MIISLQIYNNKYKRQNVWLTNQTAIKQKTTKEKNGWQIDINELPTAFWVLIFEFWVLSFELLRHSRNVEFWILSFALGFAACQSKNCRLRRLGVIQFWVLNSQRIIQNSKIQNARSAQFKTQNS